jgi:hypothetical protein
MDTMKMLEDAKNIQDVFNNLPDYVSDIPQIEE